MDNLEQEVREFMGTSFDGLKEFIDDEDILYFYQELPITCVMMFHEEYCKCDNIKPAKAVSDGDGHWYLIPEDMYGDWQTLLNKMFEEEYDNMDTINEFDALFSKYATGGDLNNTQLYAKFD